MTKADLPVCDGLVTITDLAQAAGITDVMLREAVNKGLIHPTDVRRKHGRRTFTVDDALTIIAVAAASAAIGIAFLTLLRAVRDQGVTVRPDGIIIPIPAPITVTAGAAA